MSTMRFSGGMAVRTERLLGASWLRQFPFGLDGGLKRPALSLSPCQAMKLFRRTAHPLDWPPDERTTSGNGRKRGFMGGHNVGNKKEVSTMRMRNQTLMHPLPQPQAVE